jgi:uncharacterized membrane protein YidH (DUF202 family)
LHSSSRELPWSWLLFILLLQSVISCLSALTAVNKLPLLLQTNLLVAVLFGLILGLALAFAFSRATRHMNRRGYRPVQVLQIILTVSVMGALLGWAAGIV